MTLIRQRSVSEDAAQGLQAAGFTPLMARLYAARGVQAATQIAANL